VNKAATIYIRDERRLEQWGGSYILRMQASSQMLSISAVVIGLVYILTAAKLNMLQIQLLLAGMLFCVALANAIIPAYTAFVSTHARLRLDAIFKNKPLPPQVDVTEIQGQAWREVIKLPRNCAIAEFFTVYMLVVLPVVLFMQRIAGISIAQSVHVAIGGVFSGTIVVVQNTLFVDRILGPVRRVLMPADPMQQVIESGIRTNVLLLIAIGILVLTTITFLGLLGYQELLNAALPGVDPARHIIQFRNEAILLGLLILISGLALARQLSQTITLPVGEIIRTMIAYQGGNYSDRALIIASDETAQLTIQLNQILDELQTFRAGLEQQVEARTLELTHRTTQFQAIIQLAREIATFQDVNALLSRTADLISERFNFYHTGIFLLDDTGDYVVLQAASSEGGKSMLEQGHRLPVGQQGIVGSVAYENRTRVAMDVDLDPSFFKSPNLPLTRSEAAFPLKIHDKIIGVLDIQSSSPNAFSPGDIDSLQFLVDQIALAIQNARLTTEIRDTFNRFDASGTGTVRYAWSGQEYQQKKGYRYTPTGVGPIVQPIVPTQTDTNNRINIPISLRGQTLGSIVLTRIDNANWTEADRSFATEVSSQIGLALENARLLDEAQRRAVQEQAISELSSNLSRSLDPDALLQIVVKQLHQLPNVEEVSVYIGPAKSQSPEITTLDKG